MKIITVTLMFPATTPISPGEVLDEINSGPDYLLGLLEGKFSVSDVRVSEMDEPPVELL